MKLIVIVSLAFVFFLMPGMVHGLFKPAILDSVSGASWNSVSHNLSASITLSQANEFVIVIIYDAGDGFVGITTQAGDSSYSQRLSRLGPPNSCGIGCQWKGFEYYSQASQTGLPAGSTVSALATFATNAQTPLLLMFAFTNINLLNPFDSAGAGSSVTVGPGCTNLSIVQPVTAIQELVLASFFGNSTGAIWTPTSPGVNVGSTNNFGGTNTGFIGSEYFQAWTNTANIPLAGTISPCGSMDQNSGISDALVPIRDLGGASPNPVGGGNGPFVSVSGPAGFPIPPQLADQNVLGYVFLLSAAIALSSFEFPKRQKRTPRELRLG